METLRPVRTTFVCSLDEPRPLAEVGGKAFNLRRILELDLPAPRGVVVTSHAFRMFLDQHALGQRIEQLLTGIEQTPAALGQSSAAIRELVMSTEIPAAIREEIAMALPSLAANGKLIVRSSAVGEDSACDSFAGQLDSILHVEPNCEAICSALRQCWASYWSERVLGYQQSRRVVLQGMGVIIQEQIDSAWSGVLFTEHPQHGPESMLLEFCPGLGDQLVSGQVTPESLTIPRNQRATKLNPAALSRAQLATLAEYGLALERSFGGPQDIEWTVTKDGQIYLLQSRPITSRSQPVLVAKEKVVWSNANVNENYPDPITPLLYSIARLGYYHYFRNLGLALGVSRRRVAAMEEPLRQLVGMNGARLYYNLTNIYAVLRMAPFGEWLSTAFANFVGAELVAPAESQLTWRGFARSRLRQAWEVSFIAVRSGWQFAFLERRVARFERTVAQFSEQTLPEKLPQQSTSELLAHFRGFLNIRCNRWLDASLADAAAMLSYGLLKRLLNREFPEGDQAALHNSLLKGLRDVVSGVPAQKLWELSRQIRDNPKLNVLFQNNSSEFIWQELSINPELTDFHQQVQRFLAECGFRCSGELMLTVPSFQERPAAVIEILQAYVNLTGESPAERLQRQQTERTAETARVLGELRKRWLFRFLPWPRKSTLARFLLSWTQRAIVCRERARLKQALLYSRLRRIALAIGERLVARELLDLAEDVFFLTASELETLLAGGSMYPQHTRELVSLRQAAQREVTRSKPPDTFSLPAGSYWKPDGTVSDSLTGASESAVSLQGMGVCGGRTTAAAAVLSDVTEIANLKPGDILVTRQTDPGWGPVFPLIGGLVIERGGMLSHGAILAREYGLPTVVGIAEATQRIRAGQLLTVDGDRGLVELH